MSTRIDCLGNGNAGKVAIAVLAIICMSSITFPSAPVYSASIVTVNANSSVPVIIEFVPSATAVAKIGVLGTVSATVTREFTIINGVAANVPAAAVQLLRQNPLVRAVDLDTAFVRVADSAADTQIHADQVWTAGYTGAGVRIAILDEGIDQTHQEFAGRIVSCHSEIVGLDCNPNNSPYGFHGTAVAGMAAAQGVYPAAKGVAPGASIMSDKVFFANDSASPGTVLAGINWAVSNSAKIINLSLGGASPSDMQSNCDSDVQSVTDSINNAVAQGVTVVVASGDSGPGVGVLWPACISTVIAVGAVDSNNNLAAFSNTGLAMADHGVAAPGVSDWVPVPTGNYYTNSYSGTSFSAPMVSGEIALILQKHPNLSPTEIRQLVENSANCVQSPCPNNNIGFGVVNAINAINAGVTMSTSCNPSYCSGNPTTVLIYCTFYGGCVPPSGSVPVTLTVNSVGGFSGNVNLYYAPPSPNGGNSLTGPTSIYVPAGGSNTATLTASAWSQIGFWTWTIQAGTSGNFGSEPLTIHYYYCTCG